MKKQNGADMNKDNGYTAIARVYDRLNAEMARMKTEWQKEIDDLKDALKAEREKNARLSKKKGKTSEASGDSGDSK